MISDKSDSERYLQKRTYVLQELVETEQSYVENLSRVVEGYMGLMRDPDCDVVMPDELKDGRDRMVFANIEAIFEWHRE